MQHMSASCCANSSETSSHSATMRLQSGTALAMLCPQTMSGNRCSGKRRSLPECITAITLVTMDIVVVRGHAFA